MNWNPFDLFGLRGTGKRKESIEEIGASDVVISQLFESGALVEIIEFMPHSSVDERIETNTKRPKGPMRKNKSERRVANRRSSRED